MVYSIVASSICVASALLDTLIKDRVVSVVVCYSVLQCVAVCCSVLQCVVFCCVRCVFGITRLDHSWMCCGVWGYLTSRVLGKSQKIGVISDDNPRAPCQLRKCGTIQFEAKCSTKADNRLAAAGNVESKTKANV